MYDNTYVNVDTPRYTENFTTLTINWKQVVHTHIRVGNHAANSDAILAYWNLESQIVFIFLVQQLAVRYSNGHKKTKVNTSFVGFFFVKYFNMFDESLYRFYKCPSDPLM